jgi:hypothetical protein
MFHSYELATISCSSHIYGEMSLIDQNPLAELSCRKSGGCHVHQIASHLFFLNWTWDERFEDFIRTGKPTHIQQELPRDE